jgi:hypothetical protein
MTPEFLRLRTYYPVPQAPLFQDITDGRFELPGPLEALSELELLVSNLSGPSMLVSDHVSNYVNLTGRLPDDREEILAEIRQALNYDERFYRRRLAGL